MKAAIITGDIINSEDADSSEWLAYLKQYLARLGKSPTEWEIYRGDEFQLKVSPAKALEVAIHLKAIIKSVKGLDVRMGIGIGEINYEGNSVTESNGTAYRRSGRTFETLKQDKVNLCIASGNDTYDRTLNLMLKLALGFMDDWSTVSAEMVALAMDNPDATQQAMAQKLGIRQSAVSQRQKRARLDLVFALIEYYALTIKDSTE
ncbi:MAG: SatD family protein [Flavobacteriaceae bacterium]